VNPGEDWARRLYRALLRLYPKDFRDHHGQDLLQAFDDRRTEPRFSGMGGGLRLAAWLGADFMRSMPVMHRSFNKRGGGMMGEFVQDLRYGFRMLVKNPLFTVAAVLTLALGIGMNATVFSAVRGILLEPLPGVQQPERLVQLYRVWGGLDFGSNSVPHFRDLRDRSDDVFESVAAWTFAPVALAEGGQTERVVGMMVSANFFQTYGAQPTLGRAFLPGEEDRGAGAHPIAVLGHGFWQTRFGGDPGVIGRTLSLNGHPFEVVGVAPPDFKGPVNFADVPIYTPIVMAEQVSPCCSYLDARGNNSFNVVARLRDGVSPARAQEGMDALLVQLREEYPDHYDTQLGTRIVPQNEAGFHPSLAQASMGMSAVIMTVVALLLLIACVNVANLFLARARDRRHEMALRLSLGAGRGRVVRQLLTESLLFAMVAAVAAVAMAVVATRALGAIQIPMDGPWDMTVDVDGTVLLFTGGISIAAGILFGMAPALQATRPETMGAVKGDGRGSGRSRMSSALVVAQVALSLMLLVGSGLFLRSLQGASQIDPGFDEPRNLVTAALDPSLQGYGEDEIWALLDRLVEELRALPGVTDAGLVSWLPLGLNTADRGIGIEGYEFAEGERRSIHYTQATEGYLEAMGIELLEGRGFLRSDDGKGAGVIVVNRVFAERYWPGESALGKMVQTAGDREVVGVVEDGKYTSLGEAPMPFMFLPARQRGPAQVTLVARTRSDPSEVLAEIRGIVRRVDPDLPLFDIRTMEDHMGIALMPARIGGTVLGLFGVLGMLLAAVGIYGVMAYSVAQRRRELGIRVALGAHRNDVVRMVLTQGLRLAVFGTVLGLVAAALLGHLVEGLLYNVSSLDPVAFTVVPAILVGVAALAVYLPARRAARSDPLTVLRSE
jgi:putative ABC transport system permease protein